MKGESDLSNENIDFKNEKSEENIKMDDELFKESQENSIEENEISDPEEVKEAEHENNQENNNKLPDEIVKAQVKALKEMHLKLQKTTDLDEKEDLKTKIMMKVKELEDLLHKKPPNKDRSETNFINLNHTNYCQ